MGIYKLLAVDLDDTLLNKRWEIPAQAQAAIQKAMARGVQVVLATGRMFCSALPYARQLGLDNYLITYQGAWVQHATADDLFFHRPVPLPLALEVIEKVRKYGYHVNIYVRDQLCVAEPTKESEQYATISGVQPRVVGDLTAFLTRQGQDPTKVLVVAKEALLDELTAELMPLYGDKLHICKSKPYFLEFSHPLANKGDALAAVAGHYDIAPEQIIAVGDGYNDVEMLAYAGLGVVVDNARDEIKQLADYVCPGNEQSGVAEVIEKFILQG